MELLQRVTVMDALLAGADPQILEIVSHVNKELQEVVNPESETGEEMFGDYTFNLFPIPGLVKLIKAAMKLKELTPEQWKAMRQNIQQMIDRSSDAEKWHKLHKLFEDINALLEEFPLWFSEPKK